MLKRVMREVKRSNSLEIKAAEYGRQDCQCDVDMVAAKHAQITG